MVLNTVKNSEMSHIYMFWLLVIINPIHLPVLAAMLFTLSCGYDRCTPYTLSL